MTMRYWLIAALVALMPSAPASSTVFEDFPQFGNSIVLQGKGDLRSVSLRMGQDCDGNLRLCLPFTVDPRSAGGTFELFNTAGHVENVVCASLPKESWTVAATKFGQTRYRDQGLSVGPVSSVTTRFGKDHAPELVLRASSKNPVHPLTYTLDEPTQDGVGVVFAFPRGRFCAASGGVSCQTDADCVPPATDSCQDTTLRICAEFTAPTKDAPGIYRAKSPAPVACPAPPPCP